MSYRDTKEKTARKGRKIKYILLAALVFLVAGLCVFSAFYPASTWKYYVKLPEVAARKEGELKIHFLDVGQGDSTVLEFPDGRSMIIDGGDGTFDNTAAILRYLNALKIKKPDFMLLTHSDSDHCGGLDEVLEVNGAGVVYAPLIENPAIIAEYAAFYAAVTKSDAEAVVSRRYLQISSQIEAYPYTLTFLWPFGGENQGETPYDKVNGGDYTDADVNDTSAVVWLDYSGTSALFCGDATARVEEALIRDSELGFFVETGVELNSTEILKVSHHGSATGTSESFAAYLNVKTAVISCGKNNLYGHPALSVCETLERTGAEIYRTDRRGNIVVTVFPDGSYRSETQY